MQVAVTIDVSKTDQLRSIWFVFETPHSSYQEVVEALRRDGLVDGIRIDTESAGHDKKRERRRFKATLGKAGIIFMHELGFELLPPLSPDMAGAPAR